MHFIKVMNELTGIYVKDNKGNVIELTGYQLAVRIWCEAHEKRSYSKFKTDENGLPVQLDYSKLGA